MLKILLTEINLKVMKHHNEIDKAYLF